MRWKYDNVVDTFSIDVEEYLTNRGLTAGDITEAVYMVKSDPADADAAALATLTLGDGVTVVTGPPATLVFQFRATDFGTGKLVANPTGEFYYHGVGIKTATMTKFLEPILKDPRLTVIPDFIHD